MESQRILNSIKVPVVHLGGIGHLKGYNEDFDSLFCNGKPWEDYKLNFNNNGILKIQVGEGCNDNCSYCGDKAVVGDLKSYPIDYILKQIKGDFHTVELIGDDVGAWGQDIGLNFISLLKSVLPFVKNLIMQEVNIKYLIKYSTEFYPLLKTGKIKNMVIAFQSGNTETLKQMERGYTKEQLEYLINMLKDSNVNLRFHCIVGFPTETIEQFKDTIDILKMGFRAGSIFKFEPRPDTKAYDMEDNKDVDKCIELIKSELSGMYKINEQEDKLFLRWIK
jgi:tRNA A37 methylthiotransferase MiaB